MQEKHDPPKKHPHIWDTKSEQGNRGYIVSGGSKGGGGGQGGPLSEENIMF